MHLLDLFSRLKATAVVAPTPTPRRIIAVRVVSKPADPTPPADSTGLPQAGSGYPHSTTSAPTLAINSGPVPPVTPPGPGDLRRLIFAAVASNNFEQLAALFREESGSVIERAGDWMKVPDELRTNAAAVRWYSEGLHAVAQYCADRLNRPDLFQRLEELGLSTPGLQ